tara:strand:+ start:88 stop:741 length:654 start_codon:yes stop_codon:yes gene_type:complete
MSYKALATAYNKSPLPGLGVRLPTQGTQKAEALIYLFEHMGSIVTKAEAEKVVFSRLGSAPKDLQPLRHLGKQDGYNLLQGGHPYKGGILKKGQYVLVSFQTTNEFWSLKRRDETDLDFVKLKKKYKDCCATCGAREGRPHRHTRQIVVLEKGHVDPSQPMTAANIIPQCPYCNKVAGDKWIWDPMGFPKYMTTAGLMSHTEEQQLEWLRILKDKHE